MTAPLCSHLERTCNLRLPDDNHFHRGRRSSQEADTHPSRMLTFRGKHVTWAGCLFLKLSVSLCLLRK